MSVLGLIARALCAERRLRRAERERDSARDLAAAAMEGMSDEQLIALRRRLAGGPDEIIEPPDDERRGA